MVFGFDVVGVQEFEDRRADADSVSRTKPVIDDLVLIDPRAISRAQIFDVEMVALSKDASVFPRNRLIIYNELCLLYTSPSPRDS